MKSQNNLIRENSSNSCLKKSTSFKKRTPDLPPIVQTTTLESLGSCQLRWRSVWKDEKSALLFSSAQAKAACWRSAFAFKLDKSGVWDGEFFITWERLASLKLPSANLISFGTFLRSRAVAAAHQAKTVMTAEQALGCREHTTAEAVYAIVRARDCILISDESSAFRMLFAEESLKTAVLSPAPPSIFPDGGIFTTSPQISTFRTPTTTARGFLHLKMVRGDGSSL